MRKKNVHAIAIKSFALLVLGRAYQATYARRAIRVGIS
jgi:hypothetical protein